MEDVSFSDIIADFEEFLCARFYGNFIILVNSIKVHVTTREVGLSQEEGVMMVNSKYKSLN
mgnify:CR=1 FL=1